MAGVGLRAGLPRRSARRGSAHIGTVNCGRAARGIAGYLPGMLPRFCSRLLPGSRAKPGRSDRKLGELNERQLRLLEQIAAQPLSRYADRMCEQFDYDHERMAHAIAGDLAHLHFLGLIRFAEEIGPCYVARRDAGERVQAELARRALLRGRPHPSRRASGLAERSA